MLSTQGKLYNLLHLLYTRRFTYILFNPCKLWVITFYKGEHKGLTDWMAQVKQPGHAHSTVNSFNANAIEQTRETVGLRSTQVTP